MDERPYTVPVRQSLLRPMLILGGERNLVIATGMLAAVLTLMLGDLVLAAIGVAFWLLCLLVLRKMAKHDPQLSTVYVRHLNKKIYYPARPHLAAPDNVVHRNQ